MSIIVLSILAVTLSSCSYRMLDFTLVSTKNVDLSKASSFERGKQRVDGEDMIHYIFYIPLGRPNLKEAVDRAIETTPGCIALVDGVVYAKFWWAILYGQQSFLVEGTPLIDKSLANNSNDFSKYKKISIDKNGDITEVEEISVSEYYALKDKIKKNSKKERFNNSIEIE